MSDIIQIIRLGTPEELRSQHRPQRPRRQMSRPTEQQWITAGERLATADPDLIKAINESIPASFLSLECYNCGHEEEMNGRSQEGLDARALAEGWVFIDDDTETCPGCVGADLIARDEGGERMKPPRPANVVDLSEGES